MGSSRHAWIAIALVFLLSANSSQSQLTTNYYDYSCPQALPIVRSVIQDAVAKECRMAASLVRLHFHDCFVQGCDGSVLLKDSPWVTGEQTALQNNRSIRGFEVIDDIKSAVEAVCPGVVSCADIVNGPTWMVRLGRRDSTTASKDLASANLPIAFEDLNVLISKFAKQGLNTKEMVALSGAHTIGLAQCATFKDRIYNETNIDQGFAIHRRISCPRNIGST
ncbi:hypothetical protein LUZ60_012004 [Juncus effusus]|nr:hypothetical protein LUZ60_012004 [Juncus effusus]